MADHSNIQIGNAVIDATKGWFIGSFMDKSLGLRHTNDVEVKWGIHPPEKNAQSGLLEKPAPR